MKRKDAGGIINAMSAFAWEASPRMLKGLSSASLDRSRELGPHNIRANAIPTALEHQHPGNDRMASDLSRFITGQETPRKRGDVHGLRALSNAQSRP